MASRPAAIPQLDTTKANRTIPAAGKVTAGYATNDIFPAASANYLHGWAGDWLEWLEERTEDGSTPTTDFSLRSLDALILTGDGGDLTLTAGDGGGTSGDGGDVIVSPGGVTSGTVGQFTVNSSAVFTGGLSVGHTGTPVNDRASVGDDVFYLHLTGGNPYVYFDTTDYLVYDRGNDYLSTVVANNTKFRVSTDGVMVAGGASIGHFGVPDADKLTVGDADFYLHLTAATPYVYFDATDYLVYDRGNDFFAFKIVTSTKMQIQTEGVIVPLGLTVGHSTTPVDNAISVGDVDFRMMRTSPTSVQLDVDLAQGDYFAYSRSSNEFAMGISSVDEYVFGATGADFNGNNLVDVGSITATATGTDDGITATSGPSGGYGVEGVGDDAGVYGQGLASSNAPGGEFVGGTTNGRGLTANGTGTGDGIYVVAGTGGGYGAILQGVTAGAGSNKAPLRLVEQSATPGSAQAGDLCSVSGALYYYNGSAWKVVTLTP